MSAVTNAIISVSHHEPSGWLERVNQKVGKRASGQKFVGIDDDYPACYWYGGSKVWEADTAFAAFNHFGPSQIVDALLRVEWAGTSSVQLIAQGPEDENFSIWWIKK